jgi:K+-transporting ATPase ATPase C chain
MNLLRPLLVLFIVLSALTGLVYPFAITGVGALLFARQAAGSFVHRHGEVVGSDLIGQSFSDPGHFWSRPSATSPMADNPLASGGSNLGPLNPALVDAVKGRLAALHAADPDNHAPVPVDLVTASASGLDPDISAAAARYQLGRVARARGLPVAAVQRLLDSHIQHKWLGLFGEERVNVLRLNLALDALVGRGHPEASSGLGPAHATEG